MDKEIKKNLEMARKYNRQSKILSITALIISLIGLIAKIVLLINFSFL
jgi:preprotein translocase subunit Sss1